MIPSLSHVLDIANKLNDLSKTIENADFNMLMADLYGELAEAKLEVANIKASLAKALEENERLKDLQEIKSSQKPTFADGVYKFAGEEGDFCTACFDTKSQKVRLALRTPEFRSFGKWKCPNCKANFGQ